MDVNGRNDDGARPKRLGNVWVVLRFCAKHGMANCLDPGKWNWSFGTCLQVVERRRG